MSGFSVQTDKEEVVIRLDRSTINQENLMAFLEHLRLEYLALKASLTSEVLDIAEDIESKWWEQHKAEFLKGIAQ